MSVNTIKLLAYIKKKSANYVILEKNCHHNQRVPMETIL